MISDRLIWKLEEMWSFGKQQPLHMIMKIKTVGENLFTSRVLKYKVCLYFITVLIVSFDRGLSSPGSQYWSFFMHIYSRMIRNEEDFKLF